MIRRSAPLKRGRTPLKRTPVKRVRRKPRRGSEQDPPYLAWLRTQPCVVCLKLGRDQASFSDPAHVGVRGLGQKSPGREVAPLCIEHHRRESPIGHHQLGKNFWATYGLERDIVLAQLNEQYEREELGIVK